MSSLLVIDLICLYVVSFAGLGFLALYLAGKLHLFDTRGYVVSSHCPVDHAARVLPPMIQFKAWISITPLAGALFVAISRTMDYRRTISVFLMKSC